MPPPGDWMNAKIDSRMLKWDTSGRFLSPDCLNAKQVYEENVKVHEERHIKDIVDVTNEYFNNNPNSVEFAGCGASEDEARGKLYSFVRAERDRHRERVAELLVEASKSFHQSPEGEAPPPAPFLEDTNGDGKPDRVDCSLCPALPASSRGWCTINGPHKGEKCRFGTSTEACRHQFKIYAPKDNPDTEQNEGATFIGAGPSGPEWYNNICIWTAPGGIRPAPVEFRCKEGSTRGATPGTCEPSP